MKRLPSIAAMSLAAAFAQSAGLAQEPERGPIAQWTFNGSYRKTVRDVSGHEHHVPEHPLSSYVDSPGGQAMVFNGHDTFLNVPGHPELNMSDQVTVDVWLMVDDPDRVRPGCVIAQAREHYRIQIGDTTPAFGMKGANSQLHRFYLGGGSLTPGAWHRVTGVFDRPVARLYVDGELVREGKWDYDIGAGGGLCIGAKAGVTYMFAGKIDEIRIYSYPRPPRAADAPVTEPIADVAGSRPERKLQVREVPEGVSVDTGVARFELTKDGAIRAMEAHGKPIVADNAQPLMAASLFESDSYDGRVDCAPGRIIEGVWRCATHELTPGDRTFTMSWTGRVGFPRGDAIDCTLGARIKHGSPFVTVTATLSPSGSFTNRFLRQAVLHLPLALNKRKRVVQAGDRGVQWNTRHWFQFHAMSLNKLLAEPEHNIWRRFATDQNTAVDYHLWRSESRATPALSMQRGRQAPGWMSVYDERAGLLFAYRGFANRAPKSLRVEADGSGEARICLWHNGLPALDVRSPQAKAVFGQPHVTEWMAYPDELIYVEPDKALAEHWGVSGLVSDSPARNELLLSHLNLLDAPAADADAPMVSGGVPLPRGALTDPSNVRLRKGDADMPVQTRVLAWWPDRSIKWLLLTFPADGGEVQGASGGGDTLTFDLTRRARDADRYRLDFGGEARTGQPTRPLQASLDGDTVHIDTGPLELEITKAPGWLASARLKGREMLSGSATSFVDFLRTKRNAYSSMTTLAQGTPDDGGFVPESIELEEAGLLRAVVKLTGHTAAEESPRVVLRLEAYAGRSVVRVTQSFEFLHKDPREAFVRRTGVRLPMAKAAGAKFTVGGQDGPVALGGGVRGGLKHHSHLGYTAWRQRAGERFVRLDEIANRSRAWLDMSGPAGGVAVTMRNMWQQFPNEIVGDCEDGSITALFWPESEPLMDVRRYSNYPHRSQGESTHSGRSASDWVDKEYYKYHGVVGVSKTHETLVHFHGPEATATQIDSIAADFQRPPLVYCGAEWYAGTQVGPPFPAPDPEKFPRTDANLMHFARFWIHHQELWGWYGMWDYGDVRHYWRGGTGRRVPAKELVRILADPPQDLSTVDVSKAVVNDFAAQHDWDFDNGRWGWSNTEGLPNYFLQIQYLRTGDRDLFFFVEAMARHVRDVDMRHAGRLLGKGTRHGVQHWSDGNHEERQTTHSEFRIHHYLSGDMRSRDFAQLLYERVYSQRDVRIHAAHSGRLQGLMTYWEMTGSEEAGSILKRYIPCFIVKEGLCESPDVDFPDVVCRSQKECINAGNMFFWLFGAAHALIEYQALTGDQALGQALVKMADASLAKSGHAFGLGRTAIAFAALHAQSPKPYLTALEGWRTSDHLLQQVAHNPEMYGGPRSFVRGGVTGGMMTMIDVPYIMMAIGREGPIDDARWKLIRQWDERGGPYQGLRYMSWQSEYDRPELKEYLRIKHPQP